MHHSHGHCWVQNAGMRTCWKNRLWSSAATGSTATILRKTCSCREEPQELPQSDDSTHNVCKPIAILAHDHDYTMYRVWRKTVCWSLHKFLLNPIKVCHKCDVTWGVLSSFNTFCDHWCFDFAYIWSIMFSLKDFERLRPWTPVGAEMKTETRVRPRLTLTMNACA